MAGLGVAMGNGDGTFQAPNDYLTGSWSSALVSADFNGDNAADLAVSRMQGGLEISTLQILLNDQTGGFSFGEIFPWRGGSALTVDDFNGDTTPDLMTSSWSNRYTLLGQGDGTFIEGGSSFSGPREPLDMQSGDFNGDGHDDVVIVGNHDSVISVQLGNGDGTFVERTDYHAGSGPAAATVTDLDGDGHLDIAAANSDGDSMSILLGIGDGTFQAVASYPTGASPTAIVPGDFDEDGQLDLAVTSRTASTVVVSPGVGDGTFQPTSHGVDPQAGHLAVGDLDGDGILDVVTADGWGNKVSVLKGLAAGGFGIPTTHAVGMLPSDVVVGDLNGDLVPDVVSANTNGDSISVLLGQGDGTFSPSIPFTTGDAPASLVLSDVNNDEVLDVAVANHDGNSVSVLLGAGDGTFHPQQLIATGTAPVSLDVARLNGDIYPDIVTANSADGSLSVLLGSETGAFDVQLTVQLNENPVHVTVGHVDEDGDLDAVVSYADAASVSVLLGDGEGTFHAATDVGVAAKRTVLHDMDGDSDQDLATLTSGSFSLLENQGSGVLGTPTAYLADRNAQSFAVADLNRDERPDVANIGRFSGGVWVSLNRADTTLPPPYLVEMSPQGTLEGPVDHALLEFNAAMDTGSFDPDADAQLVGPDGDIDITGHVWVTNRQLRVDFEATNSIGQYTLAVGPDVTDTSGIAMDQDGDGTPGEPQEDVYQGYFNIDPLYPQIQSHTPQGVVSGPVTTIRVEFDEPMDQTSFDPAEDVVRFRATSPIGDLSPAGATWINDTTLEVSFDDLTSDGRYELVVGPQILDQQMNPLDQDEDFVSGESSDDQYTATFVIDTSGPRVVNQSPAGVVPTSFDTIQLEFDEAIDPASFDPATDVADFVGPNGAIAVTGFDWPDDNVLEISFDPQTTIGNYSWNLGPNLSDWAGTPMDQDQNGTPGEPADVYSGTLRIDPEYPQVLSHEPTGNLVDPVGSVRFAFDEPMDESSFAIADDVVSFTGSKIAGQISVTGFNWPAPDVLELTFAELRTDGDYALVIGPEVLDLQGNPLDQSDDYTAGEVPEDTYRAEFHLDVNGPMVIAHTPSGTVNDGVSSLQFEFSEDIVATTFDATDDLVSFTGPGGALPLPTESQWISSTVLEVRFPEQTASGRYTMVIGPEIEDPSGMAMDQDEDLIPGEAVHDRYSATFDIRTGPFGISHTPSGDVVGPISQVTVTFNDRIAQGTVRDVDIQIIGPAGLIDVDDVAHPTNQEFTVSFALQVEPGPYHVYCGPHIENQFGLEMDQDRDRVLGEPLEDRYDAWFNVIDLTGPYITGHQPMLPVQGPLGHVEVSFDEEIDAGSLTIDDIIINGPAGPIDASAVVPTGPGSFRIEFPAQGTEGQYTLVVGPQIRDVAGNLMDQDADGNKGETGDDQYTAVVEIDLTPPAVLGHSLQEVENVPIGSFEIQFDEAIDGGSFAPAAVTVTGPAGTATATAVTQLDVDHFLVEFPATTQDGSFVVTIAPSPADLAGNVLPAPGHEFQFVQQLPDLTVTGITVPAECTGGQDIEIAWTVTNVGIGVATGSWWDTAWRSADDQPGGDVEFVKLHYEAGATGLLPSHSYTRKTTATVPPDATGSEWIVVAADADHHLDETDEMNNLSLADQALWITTRPAPDLQIDDLVVPATLPADEAAVLSWTVFNRGDGPTGARVWFDSIYLSDDTQLDGADRKLLDAPNPEFLGAGESYTQTVDVPIPDSVDRGQYYVLVKTDSHDSEEEFAWEGNNVVASMDVTEVITPPPGFLAVSNVQVQGTAVPGGVFDFPVSYTLSNTGGATVAGWARRQTDQSGFSTARWWDDAAVLSRDEVYDEEDYWIGGHIVHHNDPVLPGESRNIELDDLRLGYNARSLAQVPRWEPGDYYLIIIPDTHAIAFTQGAVVQKSYAAGPITLAYPNPADLVIDDVVAPTEAVSGQLAEFQWTVINQGTGNAYGKKWPHNWADNVYLSQDMTLDQDDVYVGAYDFYGGLSPENPPNDPNGSGSYEPLPPSSYLATVSLRIPGGLVGDYYVIVETDAEGDVWEGDEANNVRVGDIVLPISLVQSDLQPTIDVVTDHALAGVRIDVQWTVTNAGPEPTVIGDWADAFYLSADQTLDETDSLLKSITYSGGSLVPGAGYQQNDFLYLPTQIEGTFYLLLQTDQGDALYEHGAEDNNIAIPLPTIEVTDPAPDLAVVLFDGAPGTYIAGRDVGFNWRVENNGTAATLGGWQDSVFLSDDDVFDPDLDRFFAYGNHGWLGVGGHYGAPTTLSLPDGIEGSFYFFYVCDRGNEIYEKGAEANNVARFGPVDIIDLRPDLTVVDASADTTGIAGQLIEVDFTIVNQGEEPARGPWWDAYYLSENDIFDPDPDGEGDSLFAVFPHNGDAAVNDPYGPGVLPATARLPDRVEGDYRIFVVPNYTQAIDESDLTDAYLIPDTIQIIYQPPDLQVASVASPTEATAGIPFHVSWTVINAGAAATDETSWQDGVYLSTDDVFDPVSDIELALVPHRGALDAGDSYSANQWVTPRQDLEGPYHVYVVTDARRQAYEHDLEDNNAREADELLDVTGVHADLQIGTFTGPASAVMGETIQVQWAVINAGPDSTPGLSWFDSVYLSDDALLDDGDVSLANVLHEGSLNPGGSYPLAVNIRIPAHNTGGYHLLLKTDSRSFNDVYEYQAEGNNVAALPIQITHAPTPDLQVVEVVAPVEAWSGQNLHMEWMVSNFGAAGAASAMGGWFDSVYLSRDPYVDRGTDIYLGPVLYESSLAAGATYPMRQSIDARLPAGISGPYHVLVVSDSNDRIFERNTEDNNVAAAAALLQVNLTPPADLQVTGITVPDPAQYGQVIDWVYEVTNEDTLDAFGAWYDTIYLSADEEWDLSDRRIGRVYHEGDVPHAGSYTETLTAEVPGVLPGEYYIIVRTDILNQLREIDDTNNTMVSGDTFVVQGRVLELGVPTAGTLDPRQATYYELPVGYLQDIQITVSGNAASTAELYVSSFQMPSRSSFDDRGTGSASQDPQVRLTETSPGTHYLLVYGRHPTGSLDYEIRADLPDAAISSVTPDVGGNNGTVTLYVEGHSLPLYPAVELISADGLSIPAVDVSGPGQTGVFATFSLYGVDPGLYDLRITAEDAPEILAQDAFTVITEGRAELETRLITPALLRRGAPFSISVEYANVGTVDMISPLLHVTGPANLHFGLEPGNYVSQGTIQFLATSTTGPAGVLQPGDKEVITFYCSGAPSNNFDFKLSAIEVPAGGATSELIDWSALEDEYRPAYMTPDEWEPHWQVFTSEIGSTWPEVVAFLARMATEDSSQSMLGPDLLQRAYESLILAGGITGGGGLTDYDPPYVMSDVSVIPATGVVAGVDLIFSEAIEPDSLSTETLQIVDPDGNTIEPTAIQSRSDRLWRVSFDPQTTDGLYHVYVGPHVTDMAGQSLDLDQDGLMGETGDDVYDAQFSIGDGIPLVPRGGALDAAGESAPAQQNAQRPPGTHIQGYSPSRPQRASVGMSRVVVQFSAPIQQQTFDPARVTIIGPDQKMLRGVIVKKLSSTSYRIQFPKQTKPGFYKFYIDWHIKDLKGQYLDLDKNGVPGQHSDVYRFQVELQDNRGPWVEHTSLQDIEIPPLSEFTIRFNKTMDPTTLMFVTDNVQLSGPDGPIPISVSSIDHRTFRVRFDPQQTAGEYAVTVTPEVTDAFGNKFNTNQKAPNGEEPADRWSRSFYIRTNALVVEGAITYNSDLATTLATPAAHLTVQLWDRNGAQDADPGLPTGGDAADTLVATHNVLNGYASGTANEGVTDVQGRYRFLFDTSGKPIVNTDYGGAKGAPEFYIVVIGRNEYAYVVNAKDESSSALTGATAVKLESDIAGAIGWGRYHFVSDPIIHVATGPVGEQTNETLTIDLMVDGKLNIGFGNDKPGPFSPLEWVRIGGQWLEQSGVAARPPIAIVHPDSDSTRAAYIPKDLIRLGKLSLKDPATLLHEYGHALQTTWAGSTNYPYYQSSYYGLFPENSYYGLLRVSGAKTVAFAEAWASFFAAKTLEPYYYKFYSLMDRVSQNRGEPLSLENNDYWRAWSAFNKKTDSANTEGSLKPKDMRVSYLADGIHDTSHTGREQMGAIMSIFWDLADGKGDDAIDDARGLVEAFKLSSGLRYFGDLIFGGGEIDYFYEKYGNGVSENTKRALDSVLIDHGVPIRDDALEVTKDENRHVQENDIIDKATQLDDKAPFAYTELVMADSIRGEADWYSFVLPARSEAGGSNKPYALDVSAVFDIGYGDLDLFVAVEYDESDSVIIREELVESAHRGTGSSKDDAIYGKTGGYPSRPIRETVPLLDLDPTKEYRVLVGVSGRRALNAGKPNECGDMHPNYWLTVANRIPGPPPGAKKAEANVPVVGNRDPNDKVNTGGFGDSLYVRRSDVLPYTVNFENVPEATASVVLLTITDQLDEDLDWNSFELGDVQFSDHLVDVPAGLNYYQTRVDLRPTGNDLLVDVEAELDLTSGLVTWDFTAIDPATGEFTVDPLAGFLPPNGENHEGEGFVTYTVRPRADLPSGTEIANAATILFDWNEPIDTPMVVNTIDAGPPTSTVEPLPAEHPGYDVPVSWSGADEGNAGSGIAFYDVYVSTDGQLPNLWLSRTTATAASFPGDLGRTYAFYSVATDRVGFVEQPPSSPDAHTTIVEPTTGSISGYVYADVNNNGIREDHELGLPNVPITLEGPVNGTVTTDADGLYAFTDLPNGTYAVIETQPLAFNDGIDTQGTPLLGKVEDDRFVDIELPDSTRATDYNFGERGLIGSLVIGQFRMNTAPSSAELMAQLDVMTCQWYAFQATANGTFNAHAEAEGVGLELYTADMMPVALGGEGELSVHVAKGESYVLHVAGDAETTSLLLGIQQIVRQYFTNPDNAMDVTGDGYVSPLDVLAIVSELNHAGSLATSATTYFHDVNGDGRATSLDVLTVISHLNTNMPAAAEAEPALWRGLPTTPNPEDVGWAEPVKAHQNTVLWRGLPATPPAGPQVFALATSGGPASLGPPYDAPLWRGLPTTLPTGVQVSVPTAADGEADSVRHSVTSDYDEVDAVFADFDAVLPAILDDVDSAWQQLGSD